MISELAFTNGIIDNIHAKSRAIAEYRFKQGIINKDKKVMLLVKDLEKIMGKPYPQSSPACPHSPYSTLVTGSNGGVGAICEDGPPESTVTCVPGTVGGQTATPRGETCTANLPACTGPGCGPLISAFTSQCSNILVNGIQGVVSGNNSPGGPGFTCTFPATVTQTCPPSGVATRTPFVDIRGLCAIFPGNE